MRLHLAGLWRQPDFVRFWAAQAISQFGSQVTLLALPLTAILTLDAGTTEVALLTAIGFLPPLVMGLVAGVWVDRIRRRPILIATDVGSAFVLTTIPAAALVDVLRIEVLYAVAFIAGALKLLFDTASPAFLPSLVQRDELAEGNAKLTVSRSAAATAGPGLAGALVQLTSAPFAFLVDAASFLVSALLVGLVRVPESRPTEAGQRRVLSEMADGLRIVWRSPILRPISLAAAGYNLFAVAGVAVYQLFVLRELGLAPTIVGFIFVSNGVGALLGGVVASRVAARFGYGAAVGGGGVLMAAASMLVPFAGGPLPLIVVPLVAAATVAGFGRVVFEVARVALSQAAVPDHMLGRVFGTQNTVIMATLPFGAVAGGAVGDLIGLRATLALDAAGMLVAMLPLILSGVRSQRDLPAPPGTAT